MSRKIVAFMLERLATLQDNINLNVLYSRIILNSFPTNYSQNDSGIINTWYAHVAISIHYIVPSYMIGWSYVQTVAVAKQNA